MIRGLLWTIYLAPVVTIAVLLVARRRPALGRAVAVASSIFSLVVVSFLGTRLSEATGLAFDHDWIRSIGARILLGVEPLGYLMLWVNAFSTLLAVLASVRDTPDEKSPALQLALLFTIQAALNLLFTARDLLLFFVCYETVLIPVYLLILLWGGKERVKASLKFLLFTFLGSLPFLFAVVAVGIHTNRVNASARFAFDRIAAIDYSSFSIYWSFLPEQGFSLAPYLFYGLVIAFLVKIPLWPLHTWLPDAHTEAPTSGSIVLAGVLLKMGTYGLAAIAIPLFPQVAKESALLFQTLAVFGIIFGALASWAQSDAKRLIAYSSVSHMAFVVLGLFTFTPEGYLGAILQMAAHGVATGVLFYFIGALYRRRHDRQLASYGGLATLSPRLAVWAAVACFASTALPGTAGFAAEIMILYGVIVTKPAFALLAAPAVVLSAAYILKFARGIIFADTDVEFGRCWDGEKRDELAVMVLCGLTLIVVGVAPHATVYSWLLPAVRAILTGGQS